MGAHSTNQGRILRNQTDDRTYPGATDKISHEEGENPVVPLRGVAKRIDPVLTQIGQSAHGAVRRGRPPEPDEPEIGAGRR